jgi:hypothetical protein
MLGILFLLVFILLAGCAGHSLQSTTPARYTAGECFHFTSAHKQQKLGRVLEVSKTHYYVLMQIQDGGAAQYNDLAIISSLEEATRPAPCPSSNHERAPQGEKMEKR